MPGRLVNERIDRELTQLADAAQYKHLRHLRSPMGPLVNIEGYGEVVMLCSNDYLGLANDAEVVRAGINGLEQYGAGTASVRFITGTFDIHRDLEHSIARLSGTEAALTYTSAWAANEAVFPTLVGPNDVMISDSLNHASLIDSIRQVRGASRSIYQHGDISAVEQELKDHAQADALWIVTDGVFSMEGDIAHLVELHRLATDYDAMLVVDDSHGTGVLGDRGYGTHEHYDLMGKIDIITGTLGKALGGAAGGYVAASQRVIDLLVQRSRPGLFSNALAPTIAASAGKAISILEAHPERVDRLRANVTSLRDGLAALGYECRASPSAIIPIIVGETADAIAKSARLLELGTMVIGFGYPVVPKGEARLRIQASSALEPEHIDRALTAFGAL